MTKTVAIDGPAGAGKSTIAKTVAKELGFMYVDTGALYRAVAYSVLNHHIDSSQIKLVVDLLKKIQVNLEFVDGEQCVFVDHKDVSNEIRSAEISMCASAISAIEQVRIFLFSLQQQLAKENNVIMDGRDIGTVVLPHADVKIFLTATPFDRAKRRYNQFLENGIKMDFDQLMKEIQQRDYNDSHRELAPLIQAKDALLVDTTGNTLEESIILLTNLIKEKLYKNI